MDMNCFTADFPGDIFWYNESLPAAKRSAFEPFQGTPKSASDHPINGSNNMNKRVIMFLRRRGLGKPESNRSETEHERERSFRHMMSERMRREKQKQSYLTLHSLLPMGTKSDKNSIVSTAAEKIRQMESCRERLRRRRTEIEAALADQKSGDKESQKWTLVKVRLANPTSGVDSMIEVLNCLKRMGLKSRNIRSVFAQDEFSAELEIDTKVKIAEIKEAIQLALYEADLKLLSHF